VYFGSFIPLFDYFLEGVIRQNDFLSVNVFASAFSRNTPEKHITIRFLCFFTLTKHFFSHSDGRTTSSLRNFKVGPIHVCQIDPIQIRYLHKFDILSIYLNDIDIIMKHSFFDVIET